METYRGFRPTGFDPAGAFISDERLDWLVAPVSRNRDSGCAAESNWDTFVALLTKLSPEGDDDPETWGNWQIHRFGHWGPGWFEIILVRPDTPEAAQAEAVEAALSDYPLLDDEDYSTREWNAATSFWENISMRERIAACRESRVSIFAARRDEMPGDCFDYCRPE